MFGGTNNNSNERNVNTRIRTFYSDLSCLQLSYWNENISIKINPIKSISAEGQRLYDFDRRANTALVADKALALKKAIDKKILPKMEEVSTSGTLDKNVSVGVSVGKQNTALFIEYKNDENNKPFLYLTIYTNISQDNKAPQDGVYSYKFAKISIVEDYDPTTGAGSESYIDAEFLFFYDKIKTIADICGTAAHSVNNESAYKATSRNNNGNYHSNYNNSSASNTTNNNYSAPVSSFNADDLPF